MISRTATIRTRDFKLTVRPDGQSELYDLRRDPQELNNVFGEGTYAGEQETLLVRMLNWYVRTSDVVSRGRDSRALLPYSGQVS
jgi:hypothetical protein